MTDYCITDKERDRALELCDVRSPIWSPEYYAKNLRTIKSILESLKPITKRKRQPRPK